MLSHIDTLQKDNKRLRAINKWLMAKCYSHRASVVIFKYLALTVEGETQLSGRLKI